MAARDKLLKLIELENSGSINAQQKFLLDKLRENGVDKQILQSPQDDLIPEKVDFGGALKEVPEPVELPQEIIEQREKAQGLDPKAAKRQLEIFEKLRDDFLKLRGIDPEKEVEKKTIAEALFKQLARLKQIETTEGTPSSLANALVQSIGRFLPGQNPELRGFEKAKEQLKIPLLRKTLGEVGATQRQEQEAAKSLFPSGLGLFNVEDRASDIENTLSQLSAITGIDFRDFLETSAPGFIEDIGGFSRESGQTLGQVFNTPLEKLQEVDPSKLGGPKTTIGEFLGFESGDKTQKRRFRVNESGDVVEVK